MSGTAVVNFINKVGEDSQLYAQMHQVLGDFSQAQLGDAVGQQVVIIGHNNGFDFSVEEFRSVFNGIRDHQLNATEEELTEAQFDSVDGGIDSLILNNQTFPTPQSIPASKAPIFFNGRLNRNTLFKIFHP